jgi:hypothetical protein
MFFHQQKNPLNNNFKFLLRQKNDLKNDPNFLKKFCGSLSPLTLSTEKTQNNIYNFDFTYR